MLKVYFHGQTFGDSNNNLYLCAQKVATDTKGLKLA